MSITNFEDCLPPNLRGADTTIAKIAAGLSGAGVYRVEAAGQVFVLKISGTDEPFDVWRHKVQMQQLAANAALAPRVIHVDEEHRAVVTLLVLDRSFPSFYANPQTREAALTQLGRTLRQVHNLPLPADAEAKDPLKSLAAIWSETLSNFALPAFVSDAVQRMLAEEAPARERALVLSHNDVNPTNLVYDGANLMLLDWDTAGPNDPLYDLAAISVFFRMDEETCQKLLAAHDDEPVTTLPVRFQYCRRLVAVLCGALFLKLARQSGHAGASGNETLESTPTYGDVVLRMRTGSLSPASSEGQWWFGLALIRNSFAV